MQWKPRGKTRPLSGLCFTSKDFAGNLLALFSSKCHWGLRCALPLWGHWKGFGWCGVQVCDHFYLSFYGVTSPGSAEFAWSQLIKNQCSCTDFCQLKIWQVVSSANWKKMQIVLCSARASQCGCCCKPHCSLQFSWDFCSLVHSALQEYLLSEPMGVIQCSCRTRDSE